MNKVIPIVAIMVSSIFADTLYLKNGQEIKDAVVTEIDDVNVKYKIGKKQVIYTAKKSDIAIILYDDGTKDIFNSTQEEKHEQEEKRKQEEWYEEEEWYEQEERRIAKKPNQPKISISGSAGYYRAVLDGLEDYPFNGFGTLGGVSFLIPMADIAKFGFGAYINYASLSASDEYDVKLTISSLYLSFEPKFRLGLEKAYADMFLQLSMPLSTKMTIEAPGYSTENFDVKGAKSNFTIGFFGRYEFIGAGIAKTLTGNNKEAILMASLLSSRASEKLDMGLSINYAIGKYETDLAISIGFEYTF